MPPPPLDPEVITRSLLYGASAGAVSGAVVGAATWFPLGGAFGADIGLVLGAVAGVIGGVVLAAVARLSSLYRPVPRAARVLSASVHAVLVGGGCLLVRLSGQGPTLGLCGAITALFATVGCVAGPVLLGGAADRRLARSALRVVAGGLVAGAVAGAAVGLGLGIDVVASADDATPAMVPAAVVEGGIVGVGAGGVLGIMVVVVMILPRLRAASPLGPRIHAGPC